MLLPEKKKKNKRKENIKSRAQIFKHFTPLNQTNQYLSRVFKRADLLIQVEKLCYIKF